MHQTRFRDSLRRSPLPRPFSRLRDALPILFPLDAFDLGTSIRRPPANRIPGYAYDINTSSVDAAVNSEAAAVAAAARC